MGILYRVSGSPMDPFIGFVPWGETILFYNTTTKNINKNPFKLQNGIFEQVLMMVTKYRGKTVKPYPHTFKIFRVKSGTSPSFFIIPLFITRTVLHLANPAEDI